MATEHAEALVRRRTSFQKAMWITLMARIACCIISLLVEGNRWSVIDRDNGSGASHAGQTLSRLPLDDAEEVSDALTDLADHEPALTPNV